MIMVKRLLLYKEKNMSILAVTLAIVLILAVSGTLNVVCFFIGAKVGQTVVNDEPLKTPELNPVKIIEQRREEKALKEEQDRNSIILENIDNYVGDALGQKDVP